jgi:hypothetical protein
MEYTAKAVAPTATQLRITLLAKIIIVDSPLPMKIYKNRRRCRLIHTVRGAVIEIG